MPKKSYWQSMSVSTERSRNAVKSWFAPLSDDCTPHKAEVLCDIQTDREIKARAFMRDDAGKEFVFERRHNKRDVVLSRKPA